MATATFSTDMGARRRTAASAASVPQPFAGSFAALLTPELRAEIVQRAAVLANEARAALDGADYLIRILDAADRPVIDMEPDHDAEAEADEAGPQPVTLAPVIRPTRREMRAAYRRNGDPVPENLRRRLFRGPRA